MIWFKNGIKNAENWKFTTQFSLIYERKRKLYHSRCTHSHFPGRISHGKEQKTFRVSKTNRGESCKFRGCSREPQRAQKTKSIFQFSFVSLQCHYERNFLVEKQINVSDSSSNFPVYVLLFRVSTFSRDSWFKFSFLVNIFYDLSVRGRGKISRGSKYPEISRFSFSMLF